MKTPVAVGAIAAALLVGVAAGGAATSSDASAPTSLADPTTVSVTKTVQQPVAVEKTPQACLDALDAAEQLTDDSRSFVRAILPYPNLVLKAAKAGMTLDPSKLDEVTATVKTITAEVNGITDDVSGHVDAYNAAAAECRVG